MKFLLQVGHQLDLNVSWDGGAVDNLTYQVSAGSEEVVSVTSAGVVNGLSAGIGVIEFINGGVVVGSAILEVLTAAAYAAQQGIRDGSKELSVEADVVPPAPPAPALTRITSLQPWGATSIDQTHAVIRAFDGNLATEYHSDAVFGNVVTAHLGAMFSEPKVVKKIVVKWAGEAPVEVDVLRGAGENPTTLITSALVPAFADPNTPSVQEIMLPAYTAANAIYIRPKTAAPVAGSYGALAGDATIARLRVREIEFYE